VTPIRKALARKARRIMQRKRLTVDDVAQRAGLNPRTVQRFLDEETFSEDTADALAHCFREELTDSGSPDSGEERREAAKIGDETGGPVSGFKAAAALLKVPERTLRDQRAALGCTLKRPWWASPKALRDWYEDLLERSDEGEQPRRTA
jgi:transcriptional regulator with XRE-family HTH domain